MPGLMFPEVKSANCAVPDQDVLYPQRRGDKVKTLLSLRASTEVRSTKRKEEGNDCQSRREAVIKTRAAWSQTKGRKRMASCLIIALCVSSARRILDVNIL